MYTEQEFESKLLRGMEPYLTGEYAGARLMAQSVPISNGIRERVITILSGEEIHMPSIRVEPLYDLYAGGYAVDDILPEIEKSLRDYAPMMNHGIDPLVKDFEAAKDQIYVRLVNAEKNQKLLETVPHTMVGDLAATYRVGIQNNSGMTSFVVTTELMELYGVGLQDLHAAAQSNAEQTVNLEYLMDKTLDAICRQQGISRDEALERYGKEMDCQDQLVVTNRQEIDGAGVIAFDSIRDQIAQKLQGNFYLIATDCHECLAIKDSAVRSVRSLERMSEQILREWIRPEDALSDRVYHYNAKTRELTVETGRVQKLQMDKTHTMQH